MGNRLSGVAFLWNFREVSPSSSKKGACLLKSKSTVTFILIATLVNPICCCFANVLCLDGNFNERHECWMAEGNDPMQDSPCGNPGECPYKEVKQYLKAENPAGVKSLQAVGLTLNVPFRHLLDSSILPSASALCSPNRGEAYSTGPPVRLHQAYSVYLL